MQNGPSAVHVTPDTSVTLAAESRRSLVQSYTSPAVPRASCFMHGCYNTWYGVLLHGGKTRVNEVNQTQQSCEPVACPPGRLV